MNCPGRGDKFDHPDVAELGQHVANGRTARHHPEARIPQSNHAHHSISATGDAARLELSTLPGAGGLSHHVQLHRDHILLQHLLVPLHLEHHHPHSLLTSLSIVFCNF